MDAQTTRDQELAVGITAFVSSDVPGFDCTIKHRYTDFLVNEILPDGTVLHLIDDSAKRRKEAKTPVAEDAENGHNSAPAANGAGEEAAESTSLKRKLPDTGDEVAEDEASAAKRQKSDGTYVGIEQPTPNGGSAEVATTISDTDRKAEIISSVTEADQTTLHNIFGEATTKSILNLYANVIMHPNRKPREQPTVRSEVIEEKAKRTEAHVAVRTIFSRKLSTETIQDSPGVIAIRAAPTKGPSGARGQPNSEMNGAYQKGKLGWEDMGGEYLHFTLYKENKDTMEVLHFLATQLKIPVKNFQFAGTKDRRGVTVQRVALFRVYADRIAKLNQMARNWRLGDFEYKKHGLDLGELNGNEFLLTLRDCHFDGEKGLSHERILGLAEDVIGKAAGSFKERGYLNYYGLQRFGTFSTGTHATGRKMLKGDLEGAVDSILTYPDALLPENVDTSGMAKVPQDDINRADAIRTWRGKGKTSDVLSKMPRRFQAEAAIIQHLNKKDQKSGKLEQDKDFQGALNQIQRNLRLMYVHAYQSFVWNNVVGKRWELYGNRVVEGDLVIVGEKDGAAPVKDEVDEEGEPIFHPTGDDSATSAEDPFTRARHLSKEEADSGKYDVFDIVLPLPGFDVLYPANEIGKFYEEFMASEAGGGLNPHEMRRPWKDISLSGGYRKMLARPGEGFGYELKSYVVEDEQMVETDLERLKNKGQGHGGFFLAGATKEEQNDGGLALGDQKVAMVLKMKLGSSQYATMALRELTKGGAVNYKPDFSNR